MSAIPGPPEPITPAVAQENIDLARRLLDPIRALGANTVDGQAGALVAPWVTPTLTDRLDEAITALQSAYTDLQDTLDEEDGGALGPDTIMDPRTIGGGLAS